MGWWSADVLGGDTPLDMMWTFEDHFKLDRSTLYPLENWSSKTRSIVKRSIEGDHNGFWEAVFKAKELAGWSGGEVAVQVGAVIWLNSGADMSMAVKKIFIKASRNDVWANEGDEYDNTERKAVMKNLEDKIRGYTGVPILVNSEGLFDVIAKKMDPPTATCKGHTPKEAIKDLLHGIPKDAQKRIFQELLEDLERGYSIEDNYPSLNDMIKSDQDYIDSLGIEKKKK
jgi:hypothetical protein